MVKILMAFLVFGSLYAEQITFRDLTELVAHETQKNIFLDKDIPDYKVDIVLQDHQTPDQMYQFYKIVLFDHDLQLTYNKQGKFYYVKKIPKDVLATSSKYSDSVLHYYHYKIRNITNEDVVNVMKIFPGIKFTYLKQSDIIAYAATQPQHEEILELLKRADNKVASKTIRMTIFTVNKSKAREYGSKIENIGIKFGYSVENFFSSLISSTSRALNFSDVSSFAFTLYAMDNLGVADIQQSPTLLLTNGKKTMVNSVLNIPYMLSTITTEGTETVVRDQVQYRDVGLVVNIEPKIKGDSVFLGLKLVSEELLSSNDNKPITQKITYENFVTVKPGKPVLLTGIKKVSSTFERDGVPILSSIPILGNIFKYSKKKDSELNINIMIELVDPNKKLLTKEQFRSKLAGLASSPVKKVRRSGGRRSRRRSPMDILNGRGL